MLIATVPYNVGKRLHLDPDPKLITDPDPNMQIISDPAGSGSTTLLVCFETKILGFKLVPKAQNHINFVLKTHGNYLNL
jgi:hypothetical protein